MPRLSIPLPSQEMLLTYFEYIPETGVLVRKVLPDNYIGRNTTMYNTRFAGTTSNVVNPKGYLTYAVCSTRYLAHRIIWKMFNGIDPVDQIDHIDTDKTNNRIENLRHADNSDNNRNQYRNKNNTSGYKGVSKTRDKTKWRARSRLNDAEHLIGVYNTKEEAAKAYYLFAKEHHGEFMNCDAFDDDEPPVDSRVIRRLEIQSNQSGINWKEAQSNWLVRVTINGKRHYVGSFKLLDNAIKAKQDFISNHG